MPTSRQWNSLDSQVQKALATIGDTAERRILAAYAQALDELRAELSRMYEKVNTPDGKLTLAEMTKYNRYDTLDKRIADIMRDKYKIVLKEIARLPAELYNEAFFRYAWAFDQNSGVALSWGTISEDQLKAIASNPLQLIAEDTLPVVTRNRIRSAITQGLIQGKPYPKMIKDIRAAMGNNAYEALRIARTEGQRAMAVGTSESYARAQGNGIEGSEIWDATLDGDTRPSHQKLDGQRRGEDGLWHVMHEGEMIDTPGPLQSGKASFDINCLPGEVQVVDAKRIQRIYRRCYEGKLFYIVTKRGIIVSSTPNHPILTDKGWVAANFLKNGMNIVCQRGAQKFPQGIADIKNEPTMIGEIFDLLSIVLPVKRMLSGKKQFHGDRSNGNIDVININSLLPFRLIAKGFKPTNSFNFSESSKRLGVFLSFGLFDFCIDWIRSVSNCIMGGRTKALAFFRRCLSHTGKHGFTTVSECDSILCEDAPDGLATNAIIKSERLDGLPGEIFLDEIVNILENDFSGHVYNLQTKNNAYTVNVAHNSDNGQVCGAIVHNCRCRTRFQIDGYAPQVRRTRDGGIIPYTTYENWKPNLNNAGRFTRPSRR